jgi:hypothetical protein
MKMRARRELQSELNFTMSQTLPNSMYLTLQALYLTMPLTTYNITIALRK